MPEPFGVAFGAAFGADIAARLVAKLVSLAAKEVIQAWNVDKDLRKLGNRVEEIGALLNDARNKKTTVAVIDKWLDNLEEVANDTEAFFDELEYETTRKTVKYHGKEIRSFISSKNPYYRHKVASRIKSIHASFDGIFKKAKDLGLAVVPYLNIADQSRDIRYKPPHEDNTLIVGRDKDISELVKKFHVANEQDFHVVAIVGMGGQGKTTLAQMVLNNPDVNNMFTKKMWITVSHDFNFIKIMSQMVQSLTSTNLFLDNAQGLINKLQKSLKGEKCLLVLDDVWNEESNKWEDLRNSLLGVGGAKGSIVLVTTRKHKVIDAIQNCDPYTLGELQDGDSYELFKKIAFQDGVSETEPFVDMGRSMVKRFRGLPLAIKALGGVLRSMKSEREWQRIQNSEAWISQDVMSSLRLSYDNLPSSSLKQCFVYCSIIPKDSWIHKDELIQRWMASGFLVPRSGSDELMEDTGSEYFNILLSHSLLQDIEKDEFGNIQSCKMHDLVHYLAQDLYKQHSPTSSTHLPVLVFTDENVESAEKLPKSFQKMKYIRYLDISCLRSKLPDYITELYNLQTLRVWDVEELPKKFCNLINLRHLYFKKPHGKRCLLYGIDRLTCLQTLPHFVVSKYQNCLIGQLEGLHNLRGTVQLYGLRDVPNKEEASKAKLCTKSNIQSLLLNWEDVKRSNMMSLFLNWVYEREREIEREKNNKCIIEGLEPHTNLKELIIEGFTGKIFASWIKKMTNLVKITLKSCKRCEKFPSLGHLPKLREMKIWEMDDLRIIGNSDASESSGKVTTTYPSLTKVCLEFLPKLEKWLEQDVGVQVFPKLEVLEIESCSKLKSMPDSCFLSLKKLKISNSDMIALAMSKKVSFLTDLRKEDLLKNNSQSLKHYKQISKSI